ncbi:MAG TPA: polysaccharide pyruvyl transferase family protein, partial [Bacteroidetes bacterium]|nr:polysaccharide pyruvyl transferase family protein [Bacteroidota bacterium]
MQSIKNIKKRVGILTFHFSRHNYGAVLQTYASFNILKKLGYEPKIINLLPRNSPRRRIYSIIVREGVFEKFRKRHLSLTNKYYSGSDLSELNKMFDVFYVGSDQVWRPSMAGGLLPHYYLDFADDEKLKMTYAVSFGTSQWEGTDEQNEILRPLIKRFNHISVRESEGVEICDKIFNVKAVHVLDPTLLLDENDYSPILNEFKKVIFKDNKYIGVY